MSGTRRSLDPVGDRLPALLSHQRAVAEFEVGEFEPFPGDNILLADHKLILPLAFHVERDCLPAVMDGDLHDHLVDRPGPERGDILCLRTFQPFAPRTRLP